MTLLGVPKFRRLFAAYLISSIGDTLAIVVLTIMIHDSMRSAFAVSALLLSSLVPIVVFAPVAWRLVDRFSAEKVLGFAALFQALMAAGLAFTDSLPLILLLAFALESGTAAAQPALLVIVPRLAREDEITRANAWLEMARIGGGVSGPLLAGVLSALVGFSAALLVNAVSFLVLAYVAFSLSGGSLATDNLPTHASTVELRALRAGGRIYQRDPVLLMGVGVLVCATIFVSTINVLLVFFVKDVLHRGDVAFGLAAAAWALGSVSALSITGRLLKPHRLLSSLIGACTLVGIALAFPAIVPSMFLTVPCLAVGGACNGVWNVSMRSLVHHRVANHLQAKAFATYFAGYTGAKIIALGLGGVSLNVFGPRVSLLIAGTTAAALGSIGFLISLQRGIVGEESLKTL